MQIDGVLLREYSTAEYEDHAEGMQQAALFRRERQFVVNVVFGVCLRESAKSAGDIGVSSLPIDRVLLCEYSPADNADDAERMQQGCIISQRKTVCAVNVVLGFVCVTQRDLRDTLGFLCVD